MLQSQQLPGGTDVEASRSEASITANAPGRSPIRLLFGAFVLHAIIVLIVLPQLKSSLAKTYSMGFGDLYDVIAKNLDEGHGYRAELTMGETMIREPGYPLLLAGVFKIAGYGIHQARAISVLLAFGAALLLLRLARKITDDEMTARAAAVLFLLYPGILMAEARAGIEVPSIFTVLLFMLGLYGAVEKQSMWRFWAAGMLLGLAALVRSEVLPFPLLLLGYLLLVAKTWVARRVAAGRIVALVFGAIAVISPWIVRNYLLVRQVVPSATVAGVAAQEGLYTCVSPGPFVLGQTKAGVERAALARQLGLSFIGPYYQLFYAPQDEIAFNRALLEHVSAEYRGNPELLAGCAAKNVLFNFWFLGKRPQSTLLNVALQGPLLVLAFGGAAVLRKRGRLRKADLVLLYIVYIPAVHAVIIAHARHSMLVVPFLAILAATSFLSAWRAWRVCHFRVT